MMLNQFQRMSLVQQPANPFAAEPSVAVDSSEHEKLTTQVKELQERNYDLL